MVIMGTRIAAREQHHVLIQHQCRGKIGGDGQAFTERLRSPCLHTIGAVEANDLRSIEEQDPSAVGRQCQRDHPTPWLLPEHPSGTGFHGHEQTLAFVHAVVMVLRIARLDRWSLVDREEQHAVVAENLLRRARPFVGSKRSPRRRVVRGIVQVVRPLVDVVRAGFDDLRPGVALLVIGNAVRTDDSHHLAHRNGTPLLSHDEVDRVVDVGQTA